MSNIKHLNIWSIYPANVKHILSAKVNLSTGKKHFLIEVEDAEIGNADADNNADYGVNNEADAEIGSPHADNGANNGKYAGIEGPNADNGANNGENAEKGSPDAKNGAISKFKETVHEVSKSSEVEISKSKEIVDEVSKSSEADYEADYEDNMLNCPCHDKCNKIENKDKKFKCEIHCDDQCWLWMNNL